MGAGGPLSGVRESGRAAGCWLLEAVSGRGRGCSGRLRGALLEDEEMGVSGGGLGPRLTYPTHQAFSAFADLTIKSLADIEEEVGTGAGRRGRGCWDLAPHQATLVFPNHTPPLQGCRLCPPFLTAPPHSPSLTLCSPTRSTTMASWWRRQQLHVCPPACRSPFTIPGRRLLPHTPGLVARHPSPCWGPWQRRAFRPLSHMGSCHPGEG